MDRNTIIGFVLIGLVLMLWMYMNAPPPQAPQTGHDSTRTTQTAIPPESAKTAPGPTTTRAQGAGKDSVGKFFAKFETGPKKNIIIETNLYRAEISSQGGAIRSWVLKNFTTWNKYPVDLINARDQGEFHLLFYSSDGKLVNTKSLIFTTPLQDGAHITIAPGDSLRVDFTLAVDANSKIVKSLIFSGSTYSFDAAYRFEGMENIISNFEYQVTWESGLRYQEENSINESNFAKAAAYAGGEETEADASKFGETVKQNISGRVNWIADRNKYFAVAILPREKESQGAYLEGTRLKEPNEGAMEVYSMALKMQYSAGSVETDRFTVFLGPLDFDLVKKYNVDLDKIMSLGAAWIIRPISEYVIIPLFKFLHYAIPNYGWVLIVFSIIIKIVLYPLTKTSMKSMQKMQKLQPMMDEIKTKYKDDPQKMNQQVMRLYKEYGVNPAGGCLPMLLQLPILYALWAVFSSTIDLRQQPFFGWIHDLSVPDIITTLPFKLPIFGMDQISGLAVLMGITMFVQQKMSVKDPRQKAMVWMMPILLTLMFNGFPAGLNLYYFTFNLLSIGQQAWINKQHKDEPLRKVEEKKRGGLIGRLAENIAQAKGAKR